MNNFNWITIKWINGDPDKQLSYTSAFKVQTTNCGTVTANFILQIFSTLLILAFFVDTTQVRKYCE